MKIGVIGAGHAGVEAARTAIHAGGEVTLFSAESVLPYYRPRLVELAFGQAKFPAIQMHPEIWYSEQGIELRLKSRIEPFSAQSLEITSSGSVFRFDGVVLACGACPNLPPFAGTPGVCVLPLWNIEHANAIRQKVKAGRRLVIVGGGILGIEAALRAVDAGMTVQIVEHSERLMPAQFAARGSAVLLRRLNEKGISIVLGHGITSSRPSSDNRTLLELDDGRILETDMCLVSIGARPEKSLAVSAGLTTERGVIVNSFLQSSAAGVFAAGDIAQYGGKTRCSAQTAANQGKIAGMNIIASLKSNPMKPYAPEALPLMFKSRDLELYSVGEPGGVDCEERILEGSSESVIRSLIVKDNIPVGVQMIGTREGLDEYLALVRQAQVTSARSPKL